jgi:hypothetical protein
VLTSIRLTDIRLFPNYLTNGLTKATRSHKDETVYLITRDLHRLSPDDSARINAENIRRVRLESGPNSPAYHHLRGLLESTRTNLTDTAGKDRFN